MTGALTPFQYFLTREARSSIKPHRPAVLWFTGLPGSGKSTLANAVEVELHRRFQAHTYILDGDNLRGGLNRDLGFSPEDRAENIRRIGEVANLFVDAGLIVLTAFVSPYRADRDGVRARLPENTFFEVYVACPLAVCEARDPKGLYARARQGLIPDMTGVQSPYEEPLQPELALQTDRWPLEACVARVIGMLKERGIL
jgi:adenylylsulfate kinase